jgi:TonB dependent receptor/CarboxypepD_reg-like domain/TonB-dependent Receptor Plug Domain
MLMSSATRKLAKRTTCPFATLIFWLTAILLLTQVKPAYAQETLITINVKDTELGEVLKLLAQQAGLEFSYNPRRIDIKQKLSILATDKPLKAVLDELAAKTGIKYIVLEDQIVLQRADPKDDEKATLSGFVKDIKTGEPLIGASIVIKELGIGVCSNAFGFYSITVKAATYDVECSYIGYGAFGATIDVNANSSFEIRLTEEPPVLPELLIRDEGESIGATPHTGETNIKPNLVRQRPAYFGEVDVIKSLESIPGVKMHSDGSTFYYVRGGNRDQNLVLIDDAPIYNPTHLLGLFSTIIPDAVNDITFYNGDTPASMGGRLSSVLDIRTKKGNDQHVTAWGGASLVSTRFGIEGPFKRDKSSFLLSTRVSRLKWLTRLANIDATEFQFYDVTGKMNFSINKRNRVFFSFYSGQDAYFNPSLGIKWANKTGTIKWSSVINDKMFVNTTFVASGYDYFLYTDVANNRRWNSHIGNIALKADFSYFAKPGSEMNFGIAITGYNFNPGNFEGNAPVPSNLISSIRNSSETVLYVSHNKEFTDRWKLDYGVRFSSWKNNGDSFEFRYNNSRSVVDTLYFPKGASYSRYINLEPRFALRYQPGEHSSLKASYTRNVQNVHMISNSVSPFSSLEVWLPSNINIQPQRSDQVTLGYYRAFQTAGVTALVEVFGKRMSNLIDFLPHAETLLNPLVESQLLFGKGRAYGIEFQVKKAEGRVRGIAGYSYSRSSRTFGEIDGGRSFNAFSDRPHQVNLTLAYDISSRWEIGLNWNYSTGAPFSSPVGFYSYNDAPVPIFGRKNNDRLPDYHRMDVSGTWKLNKNSERRYQHSLTFAIFNFYGRKNILFYNYNKVVAGDGSIKVFGNMLGANHIVSNYYLSSFTPSIAYNFKWR